jgi:acetyl esterase/lipase
MPETQTVAYGYVDGASLLADIALPDLPGKRPLILSVHGGRWYYGTRRDTGAIDVAQWAGFGFVAMSIDYRLVTCSPAPACYQDMLCAIRWAHANAAAYGIDADQIFLIGMSAGGHMVSLAATLGNGDFPLSGGWDDFPASFRAAISVSGTYDLVKLDWGAGWVPPGEPFPHAREYASPIRHVSVATRPLLLLHSDDDPSIPIEQVLRMEAELRRAGAPHRFVRYQDRGHMFITDEVIAHSRAFIDSFAAQV